MCMTAGKLIIIITFVSSLLAYDCCKMFYVLLIITDVLLLSPELAWPVSSEGATFYAMFVGN
jgi:hypothetical protein